MAQICSSQFGNSLLSLDLLFFFYYCSSLLNQITMKTVQKGGGWWGMVEDFRRALAKIHSKKFQFYTKHLTLRVYKKIVLLGFVDIYTSYLPKKVVRFFVVVFFFVH